MTVPQACEATPIPVVDFSAEEASVVKTWRRACIDHGFLYLTNHGIPESLVSEFFEQQHAFFRLPLDQKMSIVQDENNRGYTPYKESTLDPENSKRPDTHEGLYFGREVAADSEEAKLPLHGPNQWPSEDLLPNYRRVTQAYYDAVTALMRRSLHILALSLDLPRDHFDAMFAKPIASLRPLHYRHAAVLGVPCDGLRIKVDVLGAEVASPEDGGFSAGAHTDYGCLTFLMTDGTPGLQICPDGEWVAVPHIRGAFVINLGDMLERWTGGLYRSTLHRVVCTCGKERFSAAFFVEPSFETVVQVFPECLAKGGKSYPPIQSGEYLLGKYRATHSGYSLAKEGHAIAA